MATSTSRYAVTCTAASGSVEMQGSVSNRNLAIGLALFFPAGGLQWMRQVETGMVGIYQPREDVDAVNRDEASFVIIDISHDELEREMQLEGGASPPQLLRQSGIVPGRIPDDVLGPLRRLVNLGHAGQAIPLPPGMSLQAMMLAAVARHLVGTQRLEDRMPEGGYCRIVARARAWIEAHLDAPIAIDDLVAAAITSRRTLHRAFIEVLGESPQSYVLKLRLNRIRADLASPAEAERTVTTVSHKWGCPELGRLAARYREQFGELPRETLARRQAA